MTKEISMTFFQYLAGCGNLSYPYLLPDIPEVGIFFDTMPLIEPRWDFTDYYQDTSSYYRDNLNILGLADPLSVISIDGANFTEYRFTINTNEAKEIYAISTGYLFFVPRGQRSHLLGDIIADEDMLILEPLRATKLIWRWYYPETTPVLEKLVYRNFSLDSNSLKEQIRLYHDEAYFQKLYQQLTGTKYVGPQEWYEEYWNLFMGPSEIAILVQGKAILGSTNSIIPENNEIHQLSLFFQVNGWFNNEESVKKFFQFRNRLPDLEGHPMISLLTGMPVEAGYVDYILPSDLQKPWTGRLKDYLQQLPEPFTETNPYHPIAIDPDAELTTILIQKLPPPGINIPEFPSDHGITGLLLYKPIPLPVTIEGSNGDEVIINQRSLSETEELITFQSTPSSPSNLIVTIGTLDHVTAVYSEIITLNLVFLEFKNLSIQFHYLRDLSRSAYISSEFLYEWLKIANYILGRQANVYISPVIDEQNEIIKELKFDQELGSPLNIDSENVDEICKEIWTTQSATDCHVIFTWALVNKDKRLKGRTQLPSSIEMRPVILLSPFDQKGPADMAVSLVHEIGHWISYNFINNNCTGGIEHFAHDDCSNGHTRLYLNLMASGESTNSGKLISIEQAIKYNQYAIQLSQ